MNTRIIELIRNPNLIQSQDLDLLQKEIDKTPYLQPVRALHLLGTAKYDPEKYQKLLSVTAAYTTDKKILYHLINGKPNSNAISDKISQNKTETSKLNLGLENTPSEATNQQDENYNNPYEVVNNQVKIPSVSTSFPLLPKTIQPNVSNSNNVDEEIINKENIADEYSTDRIFSENEIGLKTNENPKNSINITEQNSDEIIFEPNPKANNNEITENELWLKNKDFDLSKTIEVSEDESNQNHIIENKEKDELEMQEVNFHGTSDFLSEVKIKPIQNEDVLKQAPTKNISDSEAERLRLIAEIEKKMLENKKQKLEKQEKNIIENNSVNIIEKPIENNISIPHEADRQTIKSDESEAQIPIMNVSFFSPSITEIKPENSDSNQEKNTEELNSNIPQFINTWQNWLKIDRSNATSNNYSKDKIKQKAIEKFIENEPKISPLKEDVPIVVKENNKDISHLMTETLANLYFSQKLYNKAITAYEILIQKHPEKEIYFLEKIIEVKKSKAGEKK